MGERTELLAYVDESGNFDRSSEVLCVGGPVLVANAGRDVDRTLKEMMYVAMPHVSFPPHGAHLLRPSFHLVRWRLLQPRHRERLPPALSLRLAEAEGALRARKDLPDLLLYPVAQPSIPELERCDRWLEREVPECYPLLEEVRDRVLKGIPPLLHRVSEELKGMLVAAVRRPARQPATQGGARPDAYLDLLELYLERLLLLCRLRGEPVHLTLHLSERHVRPGGKAQPEALLSTHVEELVQRVRARGLVTGVEVSIRPPQPFDRYMFAGLAVADLAVNRLRQVVAPPETWADFLSFSKKDLGMPIEVEVPKVGLLPTIAFAGAASEVLREAWAGRWVPGRNEIELLAREQMERWVAALQAIRNGEVD